MPLRDRWGEIIGTCGISKDITQLKEMEDALASALGQLRVTHELLKQAQEQLVEAEKAQTAARLAAGVAHEIRNPLNIISTGIGFLSATAELSNDPTIGAVISEMQDAIQRADGVISTMMDGSMHPALDVRSLLHS